MQCHLGSSTNHYRQESVAESRDIVFGLYQPIQGSRHWKGGSKLTRERRRVEWSHSACEDVPFAREGKEPRKGWIDETMDHCTC